MPITKSAIKAVRQNQKKRTRNYAVRRRYKESIKNLTKAANNKEDPAKLTELLSKVYGEIDLAKKKKILHANNAARKKAKVARLVNKALTVVKGISE